MNRIDRRFARTSCTQACRKIERLALPWVGFLAQPSTDAPTRAQLRVHALAGVGPELRAGGGARNGRLRQKPYLGQRETFNFPTG